MVYESRPNVTADAAASPWRAQLGAFGVDGNARKLWTTLEKKNPAVAARQPYLVKGGKLTRLQASVTTSAAMRNSRWRSSRKRFWSSIPARRMVSGQQLHEISLDRKSTRLNSSH